ncbi:hypothetical protein GQ55_4G092800 [Panicum hallii var. hallii]|uniref:Uncharacterized protein n=1 Tax=Panicum hallii var. hallii TaxID=1504633 RepID=A0A2T7DWV4_9POAL|nr:hypothetical protein GQ55_4G092800 [Panicum hallii var. hallii]
MASAAIMCTPSKPTEIIGPSPQFPTKPPHKSQGRPTQAPSTWAPTPTRPNSLRTQTQPGHPLPAGKGTRRHTSQARSHTHMEAIKMVSKAQGPAPEHKGKKERVPPSQEQQSRISPAAACTSRKI